MRCGARKEAGSMHMLRERKHPPPPSGSLYSWCVSTPVSDVDVRHQGEHHCGHLCCLCATQELPANKPLRVCKVSNSRPRPLFLFVFVRCLPTVTAYSLLTPSLCGADHLWRLDRLLCTNPGTLPHTPLLWVRDHLSSIRCIGIGGISFILPRGSCRVPCCPCLK